MSLPIISIDEQNREKIDISKDVGKSCQKYGFFIVKDHNLKINTIENVRNLSREFFNLPIENKMKYHQVGGAGQRDYPDIKDKIFTFKSFNESNNINNIDSVMISILPQPYDFDSFEPMSDNYQGTHYSLNPKFEDANIGIGSVIRERRKNFVKTWKNIYFLQPLNKAALMHIYPNNWLLFKEENKRYFFKKEFEIKPDNESIFVNL